MNTRDRTAHRGRRPSPISGGRRKPRSPVVRELGYLLEALAVGLLVALTVSGLLYLLALELIR